MNLFPKSFAIFLSLCMEVAVANDSEESGMSHDVNNIIEIPPPNMPPVDIRIQLGGVNNNLNTSKENERKPDFGSDANESTNVGQFEPRNDVSWCPVSSPKDGYACGVFLPSNKTWGSCKYSSSTNAYKSTVTTTRICTCKREYPFWSCEIKPYADDMITSAPNAQFAKGNAYPTPPPTKIPSLEPSSVVISQQPSLYPTEFSSMFPSSYSSEPTTRETQIPTKFPSNGPSFQFSYSPTVVRSEVPTTTISDEPSSKPSFGPSEVMSAMPTMRPSLIDSSNPTSNPSEALSLKPTISVSSSPSSTTDHSMIEQVINSSNEPSPMTTTEDVAFEIANTQINGPKQSPSAWPSLDPTVVESSEPSTSPTQNPTTYPSEASSTIWSGTLIPISSQTGTEMKPSMLLEGTPTPSAEQSLLPSDGPSLLSSMQPSLRVHTPIVTETDAPTNKIIDSSAEESLTKLSPVLVTEGPTVAPTSEASLLPSDGPSLEPSYVPTPNPSVATSQEPTDEPSHLPTPIPSIATLQEPTKETIYRNPSSQPIGKATPKPSQASSMQPSLMESMYPTVFPTSAPSDNMTNDLPSSPDIVTSFSQRLPPGIFQKKTNPPSTLVPTNHPTTVPTSLQYKVDTSSHSPISVPLKKPSCENASPSERRNIIIGFVNTLLGEESLDDHHRRTIAATEWIAADDALRVCPNDSNFVQRYVLSLLYYHTEGDNWARCTNNDSTPCSKARFLSASHECNWGGVTCDSSKRVVKLNLDENNMRGTIPKELKLLTYLEELDLDSNGLVGHLPDWVGGMNHLEKLDVDRNVLSGPIPDELYASSTLRFIDIDRNILSGTISTNIGKMNQLLFFQADFNQLVGTIPTEIANIPALQYFSIFGNGFDTATGIPLDICGLNIQIYADCKMCDDVGDCCAVCLPEDYSIY